jgi:hypothetical protein
MVWEKQANNDAGTKFFQDLGSGVGGAATHRQVGGSPGRAVRFGSVRFSVADRLGPPAPPEGGVPPPLLPWRGRRGHRAGPAGSLPGSGEGLGGRRSANSRLDRGTQTRGLEGFRGKGGFARRLRIASCASGRGRTGERPGMRSGLGIPLLCSLGKPNGFRRLCQWVFGLDEGSSRRAGPRAFSSARGRLH